MENKDIMQIEHILPEDFDGTFRFTNFSNEDFIGKWGGKEYHFPALTTSPMIIVNHSPIEIQQIRKKFAKDLAEREFFKSKQYETIRSREGIIDDMGMIQPRGQGMSHASTYSIETLTPFIQQCLNPLAPSKVIIVEAPKDNLEEKLTVNEEGEPNTVAIDKKTSLRDKALKP